MGVYLLHINLSMHGQCTISIPSYCIIVCQKVVATCTRLTVNTLVMISPPIECQIALSDIDLHNYCITNKDYPQVVAVAVVVMFKTGTLKNGSCVLK